MQTLPLASAANARNSPRNHGLGPRFEEQTPNAPKYRDALQIHLLHYNLSHTIASTQSARRVGTEDCYLTHRKSRFRTGQTSTVVRLHPVPPRPCPMCLLLRASARSHLLKNRAQSCVHSPAGTAKHAPTGGNCGLCRGPCSRRCAADVQRIRYGGIPRRCGDTRVACITLPSSSSVDASRATPAGSLIGQQIQSIGWLSGDITLSSIGWLFLGLNWQSLVSASVVVSTTSGMIRCASIVRHGAGSC